MFGREKNDVNNLFHFMVELLLFICLRNISVTQWTYSGVSGGGFFFLLRVTKEKKPYFYILFETIDFHNKCIFSLFMNTWYVILYARYHKEIPFFDFTKKSTKNRIDYGHCTEFPRNWIWTFCCNSEDKYPKTKWLNIITDRNIIYLLV